MQTCFGMFVEDITLFLSSSIEIAIIAFPDSSLGTRHVRLS